MEGGGGNEVLGRREIGGMEKEARRGPWQEEEAMGREG